MPVYNHASMYPLSRGEWAWAWAVLRSDMASGIRHKSALSIALFAAGYSLREALCEIRCPVPSALF